MIIQVGMNVRWVVGLVILMKGLMVGTWAVQLVVIKVAHLVITILCFKHAIFFFVRNKTVILE